MAVDRARFRMAVEGGAGGFSPLSRGEKGQRAAAEIGPGSNTGQKGQQDAIIDYLTIVVPLSALEEVNCKKLDLLLFRIFGFRGEVVAGAIREKNWNFYEQSAVLIDRENEVVGRVGIGGKKSTVCLSLTGMGCKWVRNWAQVYKQCAMLDAKITRVDCAHDCFLYCNHTLSQPTAGIHDRASGRSRSQMAGCRHSRGFERSRGAVWPTCRTEALDLGGSEAKPAAHLPSP